VFWDSTKKTLDGAFTHISQNMTRLQKANDPLLYSMF